MIASPKWLFCLIGFLGCSTGSSIEGVYSLRDKVGNEVEIFVIRQDGFFVSDIFAANAKLKMVETGKWSIRGDSIYFIFGQVVIAGEGGTWKAMSAQDLRPVKALFSVKGQRLLIGTNDYLRQSY